MSEPFIGEIRIFGFNFAPRSWAFCDGQLLPISQNTALFSLLGTTFGGDGRTTLALPNLQGRAPMHPGRGPGLTDRRLGQNGGDETVTLIEAQMPNHSHNSVDPDGIILKGSSNEPDTNVPQNAVPATLTDINTYRSSGTEDMANVQTTNSGGSQAHNNLQPFLTMNFCIALQGLYPSRS